jgi:hypothetical protein
MGFGIEFYCILCKQRVNFSNSRAVYDSSFYQVIFHHLGMPLQRNHMQQKHTALGLAKSSAPTYIVSKNLLKMQKIESIHQNPCKKEQAPPD